MRYDGVSPKPDSTEIARSCHRRVCRLLEVFRDIVDSAIDYHVVSRRPSAVGRRSFSDGPLQYFLASSIRLHAFAARPKKFGDQTNVESIQLVKTTSHFSADLQEFGYQPNVESLPYVNVLLG